MDLLSLLGLTFHTLAFVIVLGYYGILARIVLPSLERTLEGPAVADALVAIERRAVPLLLIAVGVFLVTGTLLMLNDPQYQGLGAIRDTWSTMILLKHLVVALVIGLGIAVDLLVRLVPEADDDATRTIALRRVRWAAEGATAAGVLTILLTAAAQAS